jgi:hypothetical protein
MGVFDYWRKRRPGSQGMTPSEWQHMERELEQLLRDADAERKRVEQMVDNATPEQLDRLWADLNDPNGIRVREAIERLEGDPGNTD